MYKCLICGKEFNRLGHHIISKHSMSVKEYYDKYIKQENEGICPICSKETGFKGLLGGYHTCCSISCANIYTLPKREEHNLEKYGCKYAFQSEDVKTKIKQTNLNKYGVENPQQNKEIRQRTEATFKEIYGGIGASSETIKSKMQETNLKLYGARNVYASDYGKERIRKTNNERYNVDFPTQNSEIMNKVVAANKKSTTRIPSIIKSTTEKYGGMGAASKLILEKMQKTNIDKYGTPYFSSSDASKELSQIKYGTDYFFQSEEIKLKCKESKKLHNTFNSSKPEKDFYKELCELFNIKDIVRQYSDDRYPFACDFYIKPLDVFIELNLFWTHGKHWFDPNNQEDIEKLNKWKSKNTPFYKNAIYNWTVLDVNKKNVALKNSLNYIVLWNKQDIYEFLNNLKMNNIKERRGIKNMVKIKWTNKYSNETGFVMSIDNKNRHFVNTFNEDEAKVFANSGAANTAINRLIQFGEGDNNIFETIVLDEYIIHEVPKKVEDNKATTKKK